MPQMEWNWGDLPCFGFDFIMVDFPWKFEAWSEMGKQKKAPEEHYDTLTCSQILQMFQLGQLASKDCLLWMWGTNPMIDQQIEVGKRMGFKFVTSGTWVKKTVNDKLHFGTGYRLRCASEPFFIFTNGDVKTVPVVRTVIEGPIREHSRKPDEAYVEAERLMPDAIRRADLFSREDRPGWVAFGKEVGKFNRSAA
ncbi:MAG: DNA methyltransferase [Roseibium sp.]|nr:DNA methyltransferase [Roseibium sp.]